MTTVRQLTTRFAFETDKRGLGEFRDAISGAKLALGALATTLGVVAAGGALVKVGSDLNRAAILAKQFTDDVSRLDSGAIELTGELATAWERVQAAIPGRETMQEFLSAFVTFRQTFKDAPLEQFETLFKAAGLLARITGEPLKATFEALHAAVISGDFDALVKFLPDFDQLDANMQSFVKSLVEVDPTRVQTVQQRLQAITQILDKANPQLAKTAELMVETTAEGQWDNLINNVRAVAEQLSGPFNRAITLLLEPVNDFFDAWLAGGDKLKVVLDTFREIFSVEMPEFLKRSLIGVQSFFRDPLGLFKNLAIGAKSVFGGLPALGTKGLPGRGPVGSMVFPAERLAGPERLPVPEPERLPALGALPGRAPVGSMVFSPHVTVTGVEGGTELARKIVTEIENLWDDAFRQFPQTEVP